MGWFGKTEETIKRGKQSRKSRLDSIMGDINKSRNPDKKKKKTKKSLKRPAGY